MKKKLYRNTDEQMVAGVLAGLADYYEHDVVFYRLAFLVLLIVTGLMPGVLVYIGAWIIIPEKPSIEPVSEADYAVYN
jgi:phage shock protein C